MHDTLFANQQSLSRADLLRYATQVGLDINRVGIALDAHTHADRIDVQQALSTRIGARGTPAFFINGRQLMGAQPIEQFRIVIDDELARVARLRAVGLPASQVYATFMANAVTTAPPEAPSAPSP